MLGREVGAPAVSEALAPEVAPGEEPDLELDAPAPVEFLERRFFDDDPPDDPVALERLPEAVEPTLVDPVVGSLAPEPVLPESKIRGSVLPRPLLPVP